MIIDRTMDYFSKPITDKSQYDSSINDIFGVESWSRNKNQINRKKIMDMITKDSIEQAVINVKRLDKKISFDNPSSNMDDCIQNIKKFK